MSHKPVCGPAIIYFIFSALQIILDMGNYMMYTVFAKIVITIIFTGILCTMCRKGLGNLAWFFVLGVPLLLLIITPSPKKKKQTGLHEAFTWPSLKLPSINIATPLVKLPGMSFSVDGGDWQLPIPTAVSLGCVGGC
jgi:hypothetical protein